MAKQDNPEHVGYHNQGSWGKPFGKFAYNTSIHRLYPFYLMYGRQARIPIDLIYVQHTRT